MLNHSKSHRYYQLHQHQRETSTATTITINTFQDQHPDTAHIQPSQDHHRSTTHIQPFQDQQTTDTTDLTSNITFQDHTQQDSITNDHHYFQDHQTNTRIS